MQDSSKAHPTQCEIAAAAYLLWEKNGRPHGRDLEFWHQAEQSLIQRTAPAPATASAATEPAAVLSASNANLTARRNGPVFDKLPGRRGRKAAPKN